MVVLAKRGERGLKINSRWPSLKVLIEGNVFFQLAEIQSRLPQSIRLMVKRGYEGYMCVYLDRYPRGSTNRRRYPSGSLTKNSICPSLSTAEVSYQDSSNSWNKGMLALFKLASTT